MNSHLPFKCVLSFMNQGQTKFDLDATFSSIAKYVV